MQDFPFFSRFSTVDYTHFLMCREPHGNVIKQQRLTCPRQTTEPEVTGPDFSYFIQYSPLNIFLLRSQKIFFIQKPFRLCQW